MIRQVKALIRKNVLLQQRNRVATCTQLFIGVLFLILLLAMDVAVQQAQKRNEYTVYTENPKVIEASEFQHCRDGVDTCYDFVWAPDVSMDENATTVLRGIVESVQEKLSVKSTKEFDNKTVLHQWILSNPNRTRAAISFLNYKTWQARKLVSYVVQYNETKTCAALGVWGCDNPKAEVAIPLQVAIDSALIDRFGPGNQEVSMSVGISDFAHPDMPSTFDVVKAYGPTFFYITASFNYVIQMIMIIEEKELHLTEAMYQMGLSRGANWVAWLCTNGIINTSMVVLLSFFGYIMGLEVFVETSFVLVLVFLWTSTMAFTSMGFLLSTLTNKTSTGRLMGIGIFIFTFILAPIIVPNIMLNGSEMYAGLRDILSLIPVFGFYFVLSAIINESSGVLRTGMSWDARLNNLIPPDPANENGDMQWSVGNSLQSLCKGFLLMTFLAWYLENVLPTEHGSRESVFFFLKKQYWFPSKRDPKSTASQARKASNKVAPSADDADVDEDVKREAEAVRDGKFQDRKVAVVIRGLSKTYGKFKAVRGVEYAIDDESTFVLLGHNGAGKSTTISMLSGLGSVSDGDAEILGFSVKEEMHAIRKVMGVCPQHDILFGRLTGREHLRLFATIKGVPEEDVEREVQDRLDQTLLSAQGDDAAETYSGGMKRRLSIAIALIGNPKIVFLDEPTTGMDPLTRRDVWDMINTAKKGRVIFLTTHSMEEADVLGDMVAVMSAGRIQALGSSLRLKSRFGSGYRLNIVLDQAIQGQAERITEFVSQHAPSGTTIRKKSELSQTLCVELPRVEDPQVLIEMFEKWEARHAELGEFSVSQSTLEEVFLKLSAEDQLKQQEQRNVLLEGDPSEKKRDGDAKVVFEARDTGVKTQFKALFSKSWRYQCSQRSSCCLIVFLPAFVMLMLLAVESALFQPMRLLAMCGAGVSKEECSTKGYDLQCLAGLFETTYPSKVEPVVGKIATSGRYGGINENCNKYGCFVDLEQPDYRNVPLYLPLGSVSNLDWNNDTTGAQEFKEFQADMGFLLLNGQCDQIYRDALNADVVCKEVAGKSEKKACQEKTKDLASAEAYLNRELLGSGGVSAGSLVSVCSRTSLQSNSSYIPQQETLDQVEELRNARVQCLENTLDRVIERLLFWQVADRVEQANQVRQGMLQEYSTGMFEDPVTKALSSLLSTAIGGRGSSLQQRCTNSTMLQEFLETYLSQKSDNQTARQDAIQVIENMCAWVNNPDIVRATSFSTNYTSVADLLKRGLLNEWYGTELQTEYMREHANDLNEKRKYLARTYTSHWQAYAFHEADAISRKFNYTLYYNNSGTGGDREQGGGNWAAAVLAISNALMREYAQMSLNVFTERFPAKFACNRDEWLSDPANVRLQCDLLPRTLQISILDFVGTALFPYLLMLLIFMIVSVIVFEKENKLRVIMKQMGLNMQVYWAVAFLFYFAQYTVMVIVMWVLGGAANMGMFTLHSKLVLFIFFFTWGVLLIVYSFFLSVFFSTSRTSTAAVFLFMLILNTTGSSLLQSLTSDPYTPEAAYTPLMLISPMLMIRVILWLGISAAFKEPITMDNIASYGGGAVSTCLIHMWVHILVFSFLVWYLDNVLVVGYGVAQPLNFFLKKEYWFPTPLTEQQTASTESELRKIENHPSVQASDIPQDVALEYERAVKGSSPGETPQQVLRLVRLSKEFANKTAVKSVSLAVNEKECFAMLGHNGAGKTTLLSILTGLIEPTSGTALCDGFSIRTQMNRIYSRMGICPQHDVLWSSLTGRDHLEFYGSLKGLKGEELKQAVDKALTDVDLFAFQHRRAGKYSGGMKRRLSTAIAIIGDPRVVYLDEPSTGLDPHSRHKLWNVVSAAKKGKSIILTTHSMEEAELLGDRVGIMAAGMFQTLGVADVLKRRFGKGFTLSILTRDRSEEARTRITEFVTRNFPQAGLRNAQVGGSSHFIIPREHVVMSHVFTVIHASKQELGIIDWMIAEASLEEVFLYLAEIGHAQTDENKRSQRTSISVLKVVRRGSTAVAGSLMEKFSRK